MKQTILLLAIAFIGRANAQRTFEITGTATLLEGKKIFLSNKYTEYSKIENNILDSCIIQNGTFRFTGSLKNPATLVYLYLARPDMGLKQFFIENRKINVKIVNSLKPNLLDGCVVENAPVTGQQKELEFAKIDYNKKNIEFEKKQQAYPTADDSLKSVIQNEYRLLAKEETDILIDFIKKHPTYYVSLFWFCYKVTDRIISQPDSALALFKQLDPKLQQLPEAKAALQRINNKIALTQNKTLPDFLFPIHQVI